MVRLPIVKGKDALRALLRAGFYVHHQTGSQPAFSTGTVV